MAVIDLRLLQILKYKKELHKLKDDIPYNILEERTRTIIKNYLKYFEKFPEHEVVDLQVFIPRFIQWNPTMPEDEQQVFTTIIRHCKDDCDEPTKEGILNELHEINLATIAANVADEFSQGNLEIPFSEALSAALDRYKTLSGKKTIEYIDVDIEELMREELDSSGIKFRLGTLNKHMRGLRGGDFGIVAARPDKGKTTFIASEVTFMANQLPPDKNVLWFNNEGSGKRILSRVWQAALGCTRAEMWEKLNAGTLKSEYAEAVGRLDRIRIIDAHDYTLGRAESLIEKHNAGIVIYDMLDNFKTGGDSAKHERLEATYQRARELAVKYDTISIATSQISQEGQGMIHPLLSMLKDSKTGKQGACDWQLMIGTSDAENLLNCRWVNLPKNKLRREDAASDPRAEVAYKPLIARYEDIGLDLP